MTVFVDTGPLHALNSRRDQYFLKAHVLLKQMQHERMTLVTTDYVIDEAATSLLTTVKAGYRNAMSLLAWMSKQPNLIEIEWMNQQRFGQTRDVFRRFNRDKQWSFTDCTSYVVMKERKIKTAFSFDEHFREMGVKLL